MRFEYKSKLLGKDIKYCDTVKRDQALYRHQLSEVKKRIAFIKKALHGKELRAA